MDPTLTLAGRKQTTLLVVVRAAHHSATELRATMMAIANNLSALKAKPLSIGWEQVAVVVTVNGRLTCNPDLLRLGVRMGLYDPTMVLDYYLGHPVCAYHFRLACSVAMHLI